MNRLMKDLVTRYECLTPYERAVMLTREAFGRKRPSVTEALLESGSPVDAYWTERWRWAIVTVAQYALQQAHRIVYNTFLLCADRGAEGPEEQTFRNGVVSLSAGHAIAWVRALRQLEDETGVPFTSCDGFYGHRVLPAIEALERDGIADRVPLHRTHYRKIREIWDTFCRSTSTEDDSHIMPPIPPFTETEEDLGLPNKYLDSLKGEDGDAREDALCGPSEAGHGESQGAEDTVAQRASERPPRRSARKRPSSGPKSRAKTA